MIHQKAATFPDFRLKRIADYPKIENWLTNFGLFDLELTRYFRANHPKLDAGHVLVPLNRTDMVKASDELFGKEIVPYRLGFEKRSDLAHVGWNKGVPGMPRLIYEAMEAELDLPEIEILKRAVKEPGFNPSDYDFGEGVSGAVARLQKKRLLVGKNSPTPVAVQMFSKEMKKSYEALCKWGYKSNLFRRPETVQQIQDWRGKL